MLGAFIFALNPNSDSEVGDIFILEMKKVRFKKVKNHYLPW